MLYKSVISLAALYCYVVWRGGSQEIQLLSHTSDPTLLSSEYGDYEKMKVLLYAALHIPSNPT